MWPSDPKVLGQGFDVLFLCDSCKIQGKKRSIRKPEKMWMERGRKDILVKDLTKNVDLDRTKWHRIHVTNPHKLV
jgi:hypothetical protein